MQYYDLFTPASQHSIRSMSFQVVFVIDGGVSVMDAHMCAGAHACRGQRGMSNVFDYHSPFVVLVSFVSLFFEIRSLTEQAGSAFGECWIFSLRSSCLYNKCS